MDQNSQPTDQADPEVLRLRRELQKEKKENADLKAKIRELEGNGNAENEFRAPVHPLVPNALMAAQDPSLESRRENEEDEEINVRDKTDVELPRHEASIANGASTTTSPTLSSAVPVSQQTFSPASPIANTDALATDSVPNSSTSIRHVGAPITGHSTNISIAAKVSESSLANRSTPSITAAIASPTQATPPVQPVIPKVRELLGDLPETQESIANKDRSTSDDAKPEALPNINRNLEDLDLPANDQELEIQENQDQEILDHADGQDDLAPPPPPPPPQPPLPTGPPPAPVVVLYYKRENDEYFYDPNNGAAPQRVIAVLGYKKMVAEYKMTGGEEPSGRVRKHQEALKEEQKRQAANGWVVVEVRGPATARNGANRPLRARQLVAPAAPPPAPVGPPPVWEEAVQNFENPDVQRVCDLFKCGEVFFFNPENLDFPQHVSSLPSWCTLWKYLERKGMGRGASTKAKKDYWLMKTEQDKQKNALWIEVEEIERRGRRTLQRDPRVEATPEPSAPPAAIDSEPSKVNTSDSPQIQRRRQNSTHLAPSLLHASQSDPTMLQAAQANFDDPQVKAVYALNKNSKAHLFYPALDCRLPQKKRKVPPTLGMNRMEEEQDKQVEAGWIVVEEYSEDKAWRPYQAETSSWEGLRRSLRSFGTGRSGAPKPEMKMDLLAPLVVEIPDELASDRQDASTTSSEPPAKRIRLDEHPTPAQASSSSRLSSRSSASMAPTATQGSLWEAAVSNMEDKNVKIFTERFPHPFLRFFFNPANGPIPQPVYRLKKYLDGEERKFTSENNSDDVPTRAEKLLEMPLAEQEKQREAGWLKFKNWQYFEKKHGKTGKNE